MKARAMRDLTRQELVQLKGELVEERFNLRMRRSLKNLDNPLRLRIIDREVARLLTVLHEDTSGVRALAESKTSILSDGKKKAEKST